jgi:hypothetical protein
MPRTMKRGDTAEPITGTVSDALGPVPLGTAQEVRLLALRDDGRLIDAVVDVIAPLAERREPGCGRFTYTPSAADDTLESGTYSAEVEVLWSDGRVQTFPNRRAMNDTLQIDPDNNPPPVP